jgi:hypothetical protein
MKMGDYPLLKHLHGVKDTQIVAKKISFVIDACG